MLSSGFPVFRPLLESNRSPYSLSLVEAVGVEPTTPAPKTLTVPAAESRLHDALLLNNNCATQKASLFFK